MRLKSYTDINQSRKLAKILPLESADMTCIGTEFVPYPYCESKFKGEDNVYPAWSLTALLEIIRSNGRYELEMWEGGYNFESGDIMTEPVFDVIDTCVEMIIKLKENLL